MNSDEAVARAQADIARIIGGHAEKKSDYYNDAYRPQERNYWQRIPGWVVDDWTAPAQVMDVGGAYGTLAVTCRLLFPSARVTIVDPRCYVFQTLLDEHRISYRRADARTAPRPPEGVDVLVFTEVLEHIPTDPVGVLVALRGLLSERGRIYLSTPDAESLWRRVTGQPATWRNLPAYDPAIVPADAHAYQYDEEELRELVDAAGLRVVRWARSGRDNRLHHNVTLEAL